MQWLQTEKMAENSDADALKLAQQLAAAKVDDANPNAAPKMSKNAKKKKKKKAKKAASAADIDEDGVEEVDVSGQPGGPTASEADKQQVRIK